LVFIAEREVSGFSVYYPFFVQFGVYISPVGFSSEKIPQSWRLLYSLNPMVGVIDGLRWTLIRGETPLEPFALIAAVLITALLCISGFTYFRKTARGFMDVM